MKFCIACSMPMENPQDFWLGDETKDSCVYCTNADGSIKSCEEIFNWWVEFFKSASGCSQELAERIVRKNMKNLPYWIENYSICLDWDVATDEEFAQALSKLW